MNMDDLLKDIGQKNVQERKKAAPKIQMIHYSKIKPNPANFYETPDVEKLAAAIRIAGEIKNPLRVRKIDVDEYEVNEGHRRRLATIYNVEQMGLKQFEFVPCIVEDTTTTVGKLNLILSNSTQRERTEYELSYVKEIKADSKEKTMCRYDNTKICHTKLIARQQEYLNTNGPCPGCCRICDHTNECRYRCENMPSGHEIKQQSKEAAKCAYNQKYECDIDEIIEKYKQDRNIAECPGCCKLCGYTFECEHVCENVLENKSITENDLESVTFTFQDVKATLGYVKQQIPKTKINDKETITRLKVMSESLKKYLKEMKVVTDYGK